MVICATARSWEDPCVLFLNSTLLQRSAGIRRTIFAVIFAGALTFWPGAVPRSLAKEKPASPVVQKEVVEEGRAGPWGQLEISSMYIEAPDSSLDSVQRPNAVPIWNFPDGSDAGVRQLLTKAGLATAVQNRILDPKRVLKQGTVLAVFPPIEDLEIITPEARSIIYTELAKSELNEFHANPIYIVGGRIDEIYKRGADWPVQAFRKR